MRKDQQGDRDQKKGHFFQPETPSTQNVYVISVTVGYH